MVISDNPVFLGLLLLGVLILYWALPSRFRLYFLLLASMGLVYYTLDNNYRKFLTFGGFFAVCYLLSLAFSYPAIAENVKNRGLKKPLFWFLLLSLTLFVFFYKIIPHGDLIKGWGASLNLKLLAKFGEALRPKLALVGISYAVFKAISFVVDSYKGNIKDPSPFGFLHYMFFFPAFISGPIDRFGRFRKDYHEEKHLNIDDLALGGKRILFGLFKKFVIAESVSRFAIHQIKDLTSLSSPEIWLSLYFYSFYIYYDFAGYTDIAIGTARLFGYQIPENFQRPYLKRNISQFWQSWHITLSTWLRDYLFIPIGKKLVETSRRRYLKLIEAVSYLVTFGICGLWHGVTWNFFIWGLWHGAGLTLHKYYSDFTRKHTSPASQQWIMNNFYFKVLNVFLTFNFVSVGWVFFSSNWERAEIIFKKLFFIY